MQDIYYTQPPQATNQNVQRLRVLTINNQSNIFISSIQEGSSGSGEISLIPILRAFQQVFKKEDSRNFVKQVKYIIDSKIGNSDSYILSQQSGQTPEHKLIVKAIDQMKNQNKVLLQTIRLQKQKFQLVNHRLQKCEEKVSNLQMKLNEVGQKTEKIPLFENISQIVQSLKSKFQAQQISGKVQFNISSEYLASSATLRSIPIIENLKNRLQQANPQQKAPSNSFNQYSTPSHQDQHSHFRSLPKTQPYKDKSKTLKRQLPQFFQPKSSHQIQPKEQINVIINPNIYSNKRRYPILGSQGIFSKK